MVTFNLTSLLTWVSGHSVAVAGFTVGGGILVFVLTVREVVRELIKKKKK